jgi:hypothetical protein
MSSVLNLQYSNDNGSTWGYITDTLWIGTTRLYRVIRPDGVFSPQYDFKVWCLKPFAVENEITEVIMTIQDGNPVSPTFSIVRPVGDPTNYSAGRYRLFDVNGSYLSPYQGIDLAISYDEPPPPPVNAVYNLMGELGRIKLNVEGTYDITTLTSITINKYGEITAIS